MNKIKTKVYTSCRAMPRRAMPSLAAANRSAHRLLIVIRKQQLDAFRKGGK
jgi:hypothetical protein